MTSHKKTVLIIDDDRDFAEAIATLLESNGIATLTAYTGESGIVLAKKHHPDLILADIMMEERTTGLFAIQQIRRERALRDIPVFVLSSLYSDAQNVMVPPDREWMRHDEFFAKPVDTQLLLDRIRERLGNDCVTADQPPRRGVER